jgi:NarL family two-component system response regulator LiaR
VVAYILNVRTKSGTIRVAIVEDYEPLLFQLKLEIDITPGMVCVGAFDSCEKLLTEIPNAKPDVVLLDIGLPKMDGIACVREIKNSWPRTKTLMLSADDSRQTIVSAFSEGADGFLDKSTPRQRLAQAIARVHEGRAAVSDRVMETLIGYLQTRRHLMPKLSAREREVLDAFTKGGSLKEIAQSLGSSIETVKTHARRICGKTGVNSLRAAAWVRKEGTF